LKGPEESASAITGRELAAVVLLACALAAVMHWPLPLHLSSQVSRDVGDPLVQAWQVAWGGHALAHQPLDYFQANTFWPLRNSLAFSEALAGYAPAGLVGDGFEAAVARYNLLFLFSYALAFVGAYLLARQLGAGRAGAAVAGAAFAYAPWRLEQDGPLHVLSSGGIPLSLFLLVRGYGRRAPWTVLAGWLVAAWQVSLGFTLGLQLGYLLVALAVVLLVVGLRKRPRPAIPRSLLLPSAAGVAAVLLAAVLLARPYMEVLDDHPEARRTTAQVRGLSGPLQQFVAAPEQNLVWGGATEGIRDGLSSVPEQTLFPGLAILALALLGLGSRSYPRRLRIGLGVGALVCAVLSLGFHDPAAYLYPYRWLYEVFPGWRGIRVPGRITTLTSLALALLAAGGAQRLVEAASARRREAGAALAALLVAAVVIEGSGFGIGRGGETLAAPAHPGVPKPPAGRIAAAAPQLHLPITVAANRRYVLWSSEGFPDMVNGRGSFVPRQLIHLTRDVEDFPDAASVARLRSLGVRTVVLHPALAAGTDWAGAERKPVEGLGSRRTPRGSVVLYDLAPR
jgi:hypothetical protein